MNIIKNVVYIWVVAISAPLCAAGSGAAASHFSLPAVANVLGPILADLHALGATPEYLEHSRKWGESVGRAMAGAKDLPIASTVANAGIMAAAAKGMTGGMFYGTTREYAVESKSLEENIKTLCDFYSVSKYSSSPEKKAQFLPYCELIRKEFLTFVASLSEGEMTMFSRAAQLKYVAIWDMLANAEPDGSLHRIFFGDVEPMILLLEHNWMINPVRPLCLTNSFFALAVRENYSDLVDDVLTKNPAFAEKVRELAKQEPLSFVVDWKMFSDSMCEVLVKHGCLDLNARNAYGTTVLGWLLQQYYSARESAAGSTGDYNMLYIEMPILFLLSEAKRIKESSRGYGLIVQFSSDEHNMLEKFLSEIPGSAHCRDGVAYVS